MSIGPLARIFLVSCAAGLGVFAAASYAPLAAQAQPSSGAARAARAHHGSHPHHRKKRPHRVSHNRHGGIPQHNGGDHDVDNNGGPSDGDGNV